MAGSRQTGVRRDEVIQNTAEMVLRHEEILRVVVGQLMAKGIITMDQRTEGGIIVPGGPVK